MSRGVWMRLLLLLATAGITVPASAPDPMFGMISSPGYPVSYPNETESEWSLKVPQGYRVQLQFSYFEIEPSQRCIYDSLEVFTEGTSLGVFCGTVNGVLGNYPGDQLLISQNNSMNLKFKSDFSNEEEYVGFLAHYKAIDIDECSQTDGEDSICDQVCHNSLGSFFCSCRRGYKLQADGKSCEAQCEEFFDQVSGHLSSPEYPSAYPTKLSCNYSIRVESGFAISLEFVPPFDIEDHYEVHCPYDQLTVQYRNTQVGPLCGKVNPEPIDTQSNAVDIIFNTDGSGDNRGWKLFYSTDRIRCPDLMSVEHGTIAPWQDHYWYLDHVTYTCDVGYKIMQGEQELKSFAMLCQGDGSWDKGLIPTCQLTDCGVPEILPNGRFQTLTSSSVRNGYLSEIKYSCNERYQIETQGSGQYTCSMSREWMNNVVGVTIPYCAPVCGKPDHPLNRGTARIFGGSLAPPGSVPWQAFLTDRSRGERAGGVLLGDRWVLTAAHVFQPKGKARPSQEEMRRLRVYLGGTSVRRLVSGEGVPVELVHLHEGYDGLSEQYAHDLALVRLGRRVTLTEEVVPACLPPTAASALYAPALLGYVSGWGVTQDNRLADKLHYVGLPVAEQGECARAMERAQQAGRGGGSGGQRLSVTRGMFCAGTGLGLRDSCQGDSGGGFVVHQPESDSWFVTGIVSWGLGCGKEDTYGVYTRVSEYRDWIDNIMTTA
uniref:complement subcomponent C1r n=1 Tax=Sphyrna zygaena TaxID=195335 RepID=A0A146GED2_SPHZY|nr:C1ra [Sphyrna zygaena]BAU69612.1 C1rb [Sphyrna zygaena]